MPRKQLKPPIELRKRYAALIEACRNKILTAPSQTSGTGSGDAPITIVCRWGLREGARPHYKIPDLPDGFPVGVVLERTDESLDGQPPSVTIRHNVVALLKWFKSRAYTTYDASDLFAQRLPILMKLAKLELKLDRLVDGIDADLQQAQETLDVG